MSQDTDSKPVPLQKKKVKKFLFENTANKSPHLKLVVSNPALVQENTLPPIQVLPSNAGFTAVLLKRGADLYEMKIQDPSHDFGCDLILEIERRHGATTAVCHFPALLDESHTFLEEDETLYGVIMVQFQMKVLEQLFMFCADQGASQLMIYMDDDQAEGFGIYHDFLAHCEETLTEYGEQTQMVILTDKKALGKWRAFMEKANLGFEQDLWRQQRSNPVVRRYLKSRRCS